MRENRYRVLIADDEAYVRDLLVKNIKGSDVNVEVVAAAGDGREALEAAKKWKPEIVITDIAMPFINGLELIQEMQAAGTVAKNVIISGYDEFDYAKRAISLGVTDYLLKPFLPRELIGVLQKIVEELENQSILQQNMSLLKEQVQNQKYLARERFLKEILEGRELSDEVFMKGQELELNIKAGYYLAGIMEFHGGIWAFDEQEQVEEFLLLIKDGYFALGIRAYAVSFDRSRLSMMICGDAADVREFRQLVQIGLEKIAFSLKKNYHIQVFCGLGSVYQNLGMVRESYQEVIRILRSSLDLYQEHAIRFYEKTDQSDHNFSESPDAEKQIRNWKSRIRLAVKEGQEEEALSLFSCLMKCYVSMANRKAEYIGVSVGELIYTLANDMEAEGYHGERPEEIFEFEKKMKYGSLNDLKALLESYIRKCCQNVEKESDVTRVNSTIKQLKMLIENNLKNPEVDLEWAARQVHFSVSYVRQAFKQNTGEGFGEYLIRKRMERAGMLLQKTSMKILEIARECGYDNQRYFASSFKKYYGCTPTDFKEAVRKEQLY